jgi:acetylornithine deacetylase
MIPDRADATGRWATVPPGTPADAREELERAVARVADNDPFLRRHPPGIRPYGDFPGWETPADDPLISALTESHRHVRGMPHVNGVLFGTDASWVARKYGDVPLAVFGPGFIGDCHIDDESVRLDNVLDCGRVLALTLATWAPA